MCSDILFQRQSIHTGRQSEISESPVFHIDYIGLLYICFRNQLQKRTIRQKRVFEDKRKISEF